MRVAFHMLMDEKNFTTSGSPESSLGDNRVSPGAVSSIRIIILLHGFF